MELFFCFNVITCVTSLSSGFKTMNSQNVTALQRWVVRDNNGDVIARFATQAKAVDFANREQKVQQAIVLIDISHCAVQLIARADRDEKVG